MAIGQTWLVATHQVASCQIRRIKYKSECKEEGYLQLLDLHAMKKALLYLGLEILQ